LWWKWSSHSLSLCERKIWNINFEKCNLTGQLLNLFPISYRFEFYKPLEPLEIYIVVNFRTHKINRGTRKLTRIPMLIKKKKRNVLVIKPWSAVCFFFPAFFEASLLILNGLEPRGLNRVSGKISLRILPNPRYEDHDTIWIQVDKVVKIVN
jgi:hypothetical protein